MADHALLLSPFGPFYRGTWPATRSGASSRKRWRQLATQSPRRLPQSIYLLDPPPAILRLVEQVCLSEYPNCCYLTSWQAPGDVQHTKISFLVDTPEEALRLLQEAAQTWEQQTASAPLKVPWQH
jgi:hypothetical protein